MTGFYEIQHWTEMSEFWYLFGRQTYLFRFCNKDNTRRCYSAFIIDFEQRLVQGAEPVFYC